MGDSLWAHPWQLVTSTSLRGHSLRSEQLVDPRVERLLIGDLHVDVVLAGRVVVLPGQGTPVVDHWCAALASGHSTSHSPDARGIQRLRRGCRGYRGGGATPTIVLHVYPGGRVCGSEGAAPFASLRPGSARPKGSATGRGSRSRSPRTPGMAGAVASAMAPHGGPVRSRAPTSRSWRSRPCATAAGDVPAAGARTLHHPASVAAWPQSGRTEETRP